MAEFTDLPDSYFLVGSRSSKKAPFGYGRLTIKQIRAVFVYHGMREDKIPKNREKLGELIQRRKSTIPAKILIPENYKESDKQQMNADGFPKWEDMTCGRKECIETMRFHSIDYPGLMYGYDDNGDDGDLYYVMFECQKDGCHYMGVKNEMFECEKCGDRICCNNHISQEEGNDDGLCVDCYKPEEEIHSCEKCGDRICWFNYISQEDDNDDELCMDCYQPEEEIHSCEKCGDRICCGNDDGLCVDCYQSEEE